MDDVVDDVDVPGVYDAGAVVTWPVTPDPGIHNVPESTLGPGGGVQLLGVMASNLVGGILQWVLRTLIADVEGIPVVGALVEDVVDPLANAFANLLGILGVVGSDVNLVGAPSAGNFEALVADVQDIPLLADLAALISGVGGTVIADVSAAITTAKSDASTALSELSSLTHTAITDWNAATSAAITDASIALSQVTGLATGIESWLASGGALPTATTLAHTAITDWNTATATAISNAQIAGTQLTGSVSGSLISGATTIEQGIVDGIGHASQGAQSFEQQAVTDYNSAVATVQNWVSPITSIVSVIPNLW